MMVFNYPRATYQESLAQQDAMRRDLHERLEGMSFDELKSFWLSTGYTWSSLKCFTKKVEAVRDRIAETLITREFHGDCFRFL